MIRYFGVRHHSPAAARLVRDLIRDERPAAVLIEGPSDFNPQISELALDHRLPIAVYSSAVLDSGPHGAYHPFCVHSPEWQALRAGFEIGALVRFIDLPWAAVAGHRAAEHRYGDQELLGSGAVPALCERLGVEDFDAVWDLLVEIDAELTLEEYLRRSELLCAELRAAGVSELDHAREAFMARQIAATEVDGWTLVVCGGFHVEGLQAPREVELGLPAAESLVALTPYSFEALDAYTGYQAGMPNPGFYDLAWRARTEAGAAPARAALERIVVALRGRGQHVSPADLIAVDTTANALAALRGHAEVWRTDLVDGILGALVKDELELGVPHPMLDVAHEVLRGGARGRLAEGTSRPPFVHDLERALEAYDLTPAVRPRIVELDLGHELERARLLHRVAVLELPGFEALDVVTRPGLDAPRERWRIIDRPSFDGAAIEAAAYGSTVASAAAQRLLERLATLQRDARAAAEVLVDAALCGVGEVAGALLERVHALVASDADIDAVAGALRSALQLFRYERVLGTAGDPGYGRLLLACYDRVRWLLDGRPPEDAGVRAIVAAVEAWERCGAALDLERDELAGVLERVRDDSGAAPGLRGAALGALWALEVADDDALVAGPVQFADPEHLGDFLYGLFTLAREPVQRRRDLIERIDAVVMAFADSEFIGALPPLRRAFSVFTPREKDRLARSLPGGAGVGVVDSTVAPETLVAMLELEGRLREALSVYGVRA